MILKILALSFTLVIPCYAGNEHNHDHDHSHEEQNEFSEVATELQHLNEGLRQNTLTEAQILDLRADLNSLSLHALQTIEDRRAAGLAPSAFNARLFETAQHYIMHLNPMALTRWAAALSRKYGAGVALGFATAELSEQAAIYLALTSPASMIGTIAAGYGAFHVGDLLFAAAVFGTPILIDRVQYAYRVRKHFGTLDQYGRHLTALRKQSPIDWSLNPYVSLDADFIVLPEMSLDTLNLRSWFARMGHVIARRAPRKWRLLINARRQIQSESYPTLVLSELEELARKQGLTLPPVNLDFHVRTELMVSAIRQTLDGQLMLDSLVSRAAATLRPATDEASTAHQQADALRSALEIETMNLTAVSAGTRYSGAFDLLKQGIKELRLISSSLETPVIDAATVIARARQAESWLKVFDIDEDFHDLFTTHDTHALRDLFDGEFQLAQRMATFRGWQALTQAETEAATEYSTLVDEYGRTRLGRVDFTPLKPKLKKLMAATTWEELALAIQAVHSTFPQDYRHHLVPHNSCASHLTGTIEVGHACNDHEQHTSGYYAKSCH